ncbi:MAG: DUF1439 domain-containing protein [Xylophilus ampelinus]
MSPTPAPTVHPVPSADAGRRAALRALALAAGGGLLLPAAARAGYNVWTGEYTVPRAELQAEIAKRFPVSLRYLQLLEVRLTQPQLGLDAAANRATVQALAEVRNPLTPQPLAGALAISSGLRFDAEALALRLDRPTAERVALQGMSARDAQQLQAVGAMVAEEVLRDYPLHTFRPEDLKMGMRTFKPGAITVLADGIKVQLD